MDQAPITSTLLLSNIVNSRQKKYANLASELLQRMPETKVVYIDMNQDELGFYNQDPPPPVIELNNRGEKITTTFLHECIHAVTFTAIRSGEPEIKEYLKRLNELKQYIRNHLISNKADPDEHYALRSDSHTEELITEIFVNKELVNTLKNIPAKKQKGTRLGRYIANVYDQITDIINKMVSGKEYTYPVVKEILQIGAGIIHVNSRNNGMTL